MPNFAVPFTFPAVSRRRCGVPIRVKAAGSFKSTFDGIGKLLAASTRAPYASLRPLEACTTTPCCARHVDGSTFQRWAAAMTSMTRAVAPARRNGTYIARIAVEAPVICTPMSGLTYVLSSAGECSMTTLSTSTSSSSAISIGSEVYVPCPISTIGMTNVTLPVRSMRRNASGANGASFDMLSRTSPRAGRPKPMMSPPPTAEAAASLRKSRRDDETFIWRLP